ncbi:hypothetical protein DRW07_09090 [Alteromonas sediminis]|uniref:OmpR/PhoB-type domain-containing protein n=1 Tax=Alteromonas sediminis TaxID=2259342 RepID=A0A3N5XYZ2_9ALTE|nr:winged helix-turn-helix domain-containing protein [Alteromonas sediminis]RPJ66242.1 hypothetical protein DRW07_09090 [Alteromonas sediminis]
MRWQINGIEFCEQKQTLYRHGETVRLEPMMSELLAYFCHHHNQVISKETLLNDVWQGRYVSDNTVSKLITKTRKALQDDARNPSFIVTVPKRGYRLIADTTKIEDEEPYIVSSPKRSKLAFTTKHYLYLAITVLISLLVSAVFLYKPESKVITSAKAVTTDKGSESFPSFAPDGIRLSYMNYDGSTLRLFVKNIYSGEQVEVTHGDNVGVGPGSWNNAGDKLVYLAATQERCEYFIRRFDGLTMSEPKLIHTCNPGSFGVIKFTHDDNVLVFAESPGKGEPYSLYSIDLDSGKITWLPQPDIHLGGNSQFDVHPSENKLLISSPNEKQWEGFYQLDLNTQKLELLFQLNSYICCGIWSHDGEHVVMMGEHPARDIVQFDIDGSNKTLLFSSPLLLHRPERHSNGRDYVFTAFKHNLNITEYNLDNRESTSILNGSSDEKLAVFSPSGKQIAYISPASGSEELWLVDHETKRKTKITEFADDRHYVDLAWSPDEKKIAGLTLNAVHIINIANGETSVLDLPQKEYRNLSFKTPETVALSTKLGNQWQVVELDFIDNTKHLLDPKWKAVRYSQSEDDWLWFDQEGQMFMGLEKKPIVISEQKISPSFGRQFNVKKHGKHIAFYNWHSEQVEVFDVEMNKAVATLPTRVGHFSINKNLVLLGKRSSSGNDSDLYQTYSQAIEAKQASLF